MSLRDNSTLRDWNKDKDPEYLDKGKTFTKPLSQETQKAYRERVNAMRREKYGR
jgi:hypothetical protein